MKYLTAIFFVLLTSLPAHAEKERALIVESKNEIYVVVPDCKLESIEIQKVWARNLEVNRKITVQPKNKRTLECKIKQVYKA